MQGKNKSSELIEGLRLALDKMQRDDGIVGYILRSERSASIDIKDPSKIIDYAVLSSTALDSGENVAEILGLGTIASVLVEGRDVKLLSMPAGDARVSIFMKRNVDPEKICKDLQLT